MTDLITAPGVYPDIPEADYHADPVPETSLSHSGAKAILESPARFAYVREHPVTKSEFDVGSAAHALVLGVGAPIVTVQRTFKDGAKVDANDWRSPTTAEHADAIRAQGGIPLLAKDVALVHAVADALREHPLTAVFLDPDRSVTEESLFWRDPETSIMLRARTDSRTTLPNGRACLVDYKTTTNAAAEAFARSARDYGYHMQDSWYREGADLLLDQEHAFVFVVQETKPPFLAAFYELDEDARIVGAQRNSVARRTYAHCMTTGRWPGYPPVVQPLSLPYAHFAPEPPETRHD